MKVKNWAGTNKFIVSKIYYPATESEIIQLVKNASNSQLPLKVIGRGNSYNNIFQPGEEGVLVSLKNFKEIEMIDVSRRIATFQAGITTLELLQQLQLKGLTLSNLGTNIGDNYAAACSTGYHGSGIQFGIQSTNIISMEIVTPSGEKQIINRGDLLYEALGVGIGAFGIIIRMTIACFPTHSLKQKTWRTTIQLIEKNFEDLLYSNDHFKVTWYPYTEIYQVHIMEKMDVDASYHNKYNRNKILKEFLVENVFQEILLYPAFFYPKLNPLINKFMAYLLVSDSKEEISSSNKIFYMIHAMKQHSIEYAIPIENTFNALYHYADLINKEEILIHSPVEVRFIAGDNFWMSPAYGRDSCYLNTKIRLPFGLPHPNYNSIFTRIAKMFEQFKGRPHWGKFIASSSQYLESAYPKWNDFWHVIDNLDPRGIFNNEFLQNLRKK